MICVSGSLLDFYRDLSYALERSSTFEGHRRGCQQCVFGWMVHYFDLDIDVSSLAVLTLYKDVFCCSYPQQVRGRHHLPAKPC